MKNIIQIIDWTGKLLFEGIYSSKEVDRVLDANRCTQCDGCNEKCTMCEGTGYWGDFEVDWKDEHRTDSVYEYINY